MKQFVIRQLIPVASIAASTLILLIGVGLAHPSRDAATLGTQGGVPPSQVGYTCGDVQLGEQCGNESQTTSCGSEGALCSWCDAPNAQAIVKRCIQQEEASCLGTAIGSANIDCGVRMVGHCDQSGNCIGGVASNDCSNIKSKGCQ